jgi:methylenetetrahydrofolate dehydrogenase (NADP+)/methenyltetrahydrofolate cyclohydrolase
MILDGRELVGYIQERQVRQARSLRVPARLAIVRQGSTPATDLFLRVKQTYGQEIGVAVDTYTEEPERLLERIHSLNKDRAVTGIIVQLPLADAPELTDVALSAVAPDKDVDGLVPNSPFEAATPKAILWLLAAYNVDLKGKTIAVVGQGRLVGKPLADALEASGHTVKRLDDTTKSLKAELLEADIVVAATGQAGLITSEMIKTGTVVVDVGAPASDLADDLRERTDLKLTANPGGVGPVTVAALFDNLLRI